jgi:hypothetical protein
VGLPTAAFSQLLSGVFQLLGRKMTLYFSVKFSLLDLYLYCRMVNTMSLSYMAGEIDRYKMISSYTQN